MRCKCGYSYSHTKAAGLAEFSSYILVSDKDYPAFLKSETKVLQCPDEIKKLGAIARSTKYVGCVLECPQCSRLLLLKPETDSAPANPLFYKKEE